MKTRYNSITPYQTKDDSLIRELLHPAHHNVKNQSLAEATILPGCSTQLHQHHQSEEIYHITAGEGWMQLGDKELNIQAGDSICIPPKTPHKISNSEKSPLIILCCCAPPYSHADTEILNET